jgi:D-glycero-D-manno-heptose 1,7-bisphosphate phosphatase
MSNAAFLDRDGVINRKPLEGQYVRRWDEMHLLPGVASAITLLNQAGFLVIVVSNQRCVAKGLITAVDLECLHQRMRDVLREAGATIDDVYYCPHEKEPACRCRKPATGMFLDAARAHHIDLSASWMIGDSKIDVEAGRNAGCRTAQLVIDDQTGESNADVVAPSLLDAIHQILKLEKNPAGGTAPHQHDVAGSGAANSARLVKA